jgi:hypothetical protein
MSGFKDTGKEDGGMEGREEGWVPERRRPAFEKVIMMTEGEFFPSELGRVLQ